MAERRARLLAAALEVFASDGFHAAKIRDVCRAARLTERYFYESFADKEAALAALTDEIVAALVEAAGPSIALLPSDPDAALRGGAEAVVASLTDDPRRARILFVEMVGVSPGMEQRRRELIGALAALLCAVGAGSPAAGTGPGARRPIEFELTARALIGSIQELLIAYARDELALDRVLLVDSIERLFRRARHSFQTIVPEAESSPT